MIAGRIEGATRLLGKPTGWDDETQGHCGQLPIKDEIANAGPVMISAWLPTPDELERIAEGAPVYLQIVGTVHPPVALFVGEPPQ